MLYLQIASPKSSVLNFLDSNSFEVIISIFQRTEKVPDMERLQNRRETSMTYLEDGRCSFTNNLSENAIRPFTVGRKNWLFSDSVEGAEASAIAYTMVEMAKAHNLNIYQYLSYVLEQRPNENWSDEQLAELAPWSEKLQTLKM